MYALYQTPMRLTPASAKPHPNQVRYPRLGLRRCRAASHVPLGRWAGTF
jgi:hypothetical protein